MAAPTTRPQEVIKEIRGRLRIIQENLDILETLIEPRQDEKPSEPVERGWRELPPTPDQIRILKQHHLEPSPELTRGRAFDIIDGLFKLDKGEKK